MSSSNQPLASAARLLKEAQELVCDVELIVARCGHRDLAGRLKQLSGRLRKEFDRLRELTQQ
jgi:hypothetical protein